MNIINFFHAVSDIIFQYSFFHAVSDIIFQYSCFHAVRHKFQCYIMLLLHHFNVFGYNSTSIVMFVCFYCCLSSAVIFSHLSFCNCKGSPAENYFEEASRFGKRNVKPLNKLIGSTKWL